jgi:outer membrane protein TolC
MRHSRFFAALWLVAACGAQTQPATETVTVPSLKLTLKDALERARQYAPQFLQANIAAQFAHESTRQTKAALLPTVNGWSQFIYTQPNGSPSGAFVSNDGTHVYNDWAQVHGDLWAPAKRADYRTALAAEAVARAKMDVAARGLYATVAQNYYVMAVAARKIVHAQQAVREAQDFSSTTQKLEQGGEAAHSDVIKAQIQLEQRQRDLQDAQLLLEKARIAFAVLLFPDFRQDFTVEDDLEAAHPLPAFPEVQQLAGRNNPDIRAAQATVQQQQYAIDSARWAMLPSLSFDYFLGINANQFALHNELGQSNLGSAAQVQLNIPVWTWGAARSKVRQAELQLQQARNDLSFTQRQLLAELKSSYDEAQVAASQVDSLRRSVDQSAESLRLTILRYQAGEVTVLEVVDAQSTLIQARNAFEDGLARHRLALANLQTLTGVF